jgi:hypothetical protein
MDTFEDDQSSTEYNMEESESSFIKDMGEDETTDAPVGSVVSFVTERFNKAETSRYQDEQRWVRAYRNYRGLYGPDVKFTSTEKSRIFVKVTKTKVLAAYGQLVEVLFGNNKFPISIDPTVNLSLKCPQKTLNYAQGRPLRTSRSVLVPLKAS